MSPSGTHAAREAFLSSLGGDPAAGDGPDRVGPGVRHSIRRSWGRSDLARVDADRLAPAYVERVEVETRLTRAAAPVLAGLSAELSNEPVCLVLTDATGVVLARGGGDSTLRRALDAVELAPGFRYAEGDVGTNGIGTALEVGTPILVDGSEHYAGELCVFACAGALIHHPITGGVLGVIDITTSARHSNSLLLSFAKLAARRIEGQLLDDASALDSALMRDYHLACHHSGGGVLALGADLFVMSSLVQQHFDAHDQAAIIDRSRDSRGQLTAHTSIAELPSGVTARLSYQPTFVDGALAGGVVQVKEHRARPESLATLHVPVLPGLVGASAIWRHTAAEVLAVRERREWVILEGERGVGKLALLRAAHADARPTPPLSVLDAGDADFLDTALAEAESGADLVVHHAHLLSGEALDGFAHLLQTLRDRDGPQGTWVALTILEDAGTGATGQRLLGFFSRTVRVPTLRHHLSDIEALVRLLLDRAGAPHLSLDKAAHSQLMRLPWEGNVTGLGQVLAAVVRRRRSGVAGLEDLPPSCHSTARRRLSPLEALERDAIVEALTLHAGDKVAAGTALGVSRATIYRKIRYYGIQL